MLQVVGVHIQDIVFISSSSTARPFQIPARNAIILEVGVMLASLTIVRAIDSQFAPKSTVNTFAVTPHPLPLGRFSGYATTVPVSLVTYISNPAPTLT